MATVQKTYPNQRVISLNKSECNQQYQNHYYTMNMRALDNAMLELNKVGSIKLYLYLIKHNPKELAKKGYEYWMMSCKDFCSWAGVSKPTYLDAFKDLEEKGFLVQRTDGSGIYDFYDNPKKVSELDEVKVSFSSFDDRTFEEAWGGQR